MKGFSEGFRNYPSTFSFLPSPSSLHLWNSPNPKSSLTYPGFGPHLWDVTERGCWEWSRGRDDAGYGQLWIRRHVKAHRYALALAQGIDIPHPRVLALHRCDNPPCVNPNHLYWGDHADNHRDMVERGRERHRESTLTQDQIAYILATYKPGRPGRPKRGQVGPQPGSLQALANEFGLTKGGIWTLIQRESERATFGLGCSK